MKKMIAAGVVSAFALMAGMMSAQAADAVGLGAGDILVHVRALGAFPDVSGHDDLFEGKGKISNSYVPEVDASYFLTDHIAAEIIAGTTHHQVRDDKAAGALGVGALGSVWLLPPTLTAQYHILAHNAIDPYVGAGLNYSIFYGSKSKAGPGTSIDYKNNVGYALQTGVNYQVSKSVFVNLDVKKIFVKTTASVKAGGATIDTARVNVDPLLVGIGIGFRF